MSESTQDFSIYNAILVQVDDKPAQVDVFKGETPGDVISVKVNDNYIFRRELYTLDGLTDEVVAFHLVLPETPPILEGYDIDRATRMYANKMLFRPLLKPASPFAGFGDFTSLLKEDTGVATPVDLLMWAAPDQWQLTNMSLSYFECLQAMFGRFTSELKAIGRFPTALMQAYGDKQTLTVYVKTIVRY